VKRLDADILELVGEDDIEEEIGTADEFEARQCLIVQGL